MPYRLSSPSEARAEHRPKSPWVRRIAFLFGGVAVTAAGATVPTFALLPILPGIVVMLLVMFIVRALGVSTPALDGDEIPGPITIWIGLGFNVVFLAVVAELIFRWRDCQRDSR